MNRSLKILIWLYIALLLLEGALRKWILPGFSDALLVVRDPIAILIYAVALAQGRFPFNGWTVFIGMLAGASLVASFLAGQDNLLITIYGLRTNFLHLPLIWVMATTLTRRDAENIGKALLLFAIPMTILMVVQFKSPPASFINRGVGGDDDTVGQLYGAMGHIRPPGFFAFITGPQFYYPLVMAFLCYEFVSPRRLRWPLLAACGVAVIVALPISISRTVMVATCFVGAVFVPVLFLTGRAGASLVRTLGLGVVVLIAISFVPVFEDAREAFLSRWEMAETHEGNSVGMASILDRLFGGWDYLQATMANAPFFGSGIGMGSNVAARLSTGRLGFLLAENEWAKCLLELGAPLGLAFLGLRFGLAFSLLRLALIRLLRLRDALPLLVLAAAGSPLIFGQWAPPTILGFAVVGAGLCLASCQDEPEEDEEEFEEEEDEASDEEMVNPADDSRPTA